MISNELLQTLRNLNRADKLRVLQLLVSDLAAEEQAYLTPGMSYDVWSPYDAPGAAETLMQMLEQDKARNG
jgi:hypothetical protein